MQVSHTGGAALNAEAMILMSSVTKHYWALFSHYSCRPLLLACRFAFPALQPPAPFTLAQPITSLTNALGPGLAQQVCFPSLASPLFAVDLLWLLKQ